MDVRRLSFACYTGESGLLLLPFPLVRRCGKEIGGICLSLKCQGIYFYLSKNTLRPGIIIPVLEHCMGAEIAEAKGALTCMKEH